MGKIPIRQAGGSQVNPQQIQSRVFGSPVADAAVELGKTIQNIGDGIVRGETEERRHQETISALRSALVDLSEKTDASSSYKESTNTISRAVKENKELTDEDVKLYKEDAKKNFDDAIGKINSEKGKYQFILENKDRQLATQNLIDNTFTEQKYDKIRNSLSESITEGNEEHAFMASNTDRAKQRESSKLEVLNLFNSGIITKEKKDQYIEEIDNRPVAAALYDANILQEKEVLDKIDKGEYGIKKSDIQATKEKVSKRSKERDEFVNDQLLKSQSITGNQFVDRATQIMKINNPVEWQLFTEELTSAVKNNRISESLAKGIISSKGKSFNISKTREDIYTMKTTAKIAELVDLAKNDTSAIGQRKYVADLQKIQNQIAKDLGSEIGIEKARTLITSINIAQDPLRENTVGAGVFNWVRSTKNQIDTIKASLSNEEDQGEAYDNMLTQMNIDGKDITDYPEHSKDPSVLTRSQLVTQSIEQARKSAILRRLNKTDDMIRLRANGKERDISLEKWNSLSKEQKSQFEVVK